MLDLHGPADSPRRRPETRRAQDSQHVGTGAFARRRVRMLAGGVDAGVGTRLMNTAKWLVGAASIAHLVAYCVAVPGHVIDPTWVGHARFHVVQALLWIAGFDGVCAVVALGPFGRDAWARWVLLVGLVFAHGSYFAALVAVPSGHPPNGMAAHLPLAGFALVYAVGLALGWRGSPRSRWN